ncbi:MAG: hypothetical protein COC19_07345 [SAR86 cluster bacterium]|uniref:HTH tetR-type domain-containing protein n=1 Tax=SAR86 cluster bacterium TaxID=2030880 RepID=A0A2A4MGV0_9GAMM|nr:MAG: hypothetical protein COC19_07345 [SAR86 cluster bacterium]
MSDWPHEINQDSFRREWNFERENFWHAVFEMHKDKMQIKNAKVAISNLEKIFTATFALVHVKGFQAMSLRDLSRETGISMGGLYSYIGSKNGLASMIEGVLSKYVVDVGSKLDSAQLEPVECLKAIIFGEAFMMEALNSWYYFCFMELKGLPKEQQENVLDLELKFEDILISIFRSGTDSGQFQCHQPELLASQITSMLQQVHLKQWKLKLRRVSTEDYAQFILDTVLINLRYQA